MPFSTTQRGSVGHPGSKLRSFVPALEGLEERALPSSTGFITSNFNGTAIAPGSSLWFNSVVKVSGVPSAGATIEIDNSTVDYTVHGVQTQVAVPDATLVFSPTATSATTTFDNSTNSWVTTVPLKLGGNVFLDGFALSLPNGLPGGANPVTWKGDFQSDTSGLSLNWQFGTAVYTNFSTDYNALDVKPVDNGTASLYLNSDHAGTPEGFKSFVTGGARGGGGSNWTGSYSATVSVQPSPGLPSTGASISGTVFNGTTGGVMSGVQIVLSELVNGQWVNIASMTTDDNGNYGFSGLQAGTYDVTEIQPPIPLGFVSESTTSAAGTVNSVTDGTSGTTVIGTVTLAPGNNGINYNFTNTFAGS
jgi:hypothetical protein